MLVIKKEMVERQEVVQVLQVGKERVVVGKEKMQVVVKERAGRGELSKAMRGEHGRDLKRLRLGQEQEKEVFDLAIITCGVRYFRCLDKTLSIMINIIMIKITLIIMITLIILIMTR